jgi:hypothetical protein
MYSYIEEQFILLKKDKIIRRNHGDRLYTEETHRVHPVVLIFTPNDGSWII